jgi:hypothetical protein
MYLDAQKSLETFVATATDRESGNSFVPLFVFSTLHSLTIASLYRPIKQQTPAKHLSPAQARSSYFTHTHPSPSPTAMRNSMPLDLVLPAVHGHLLRMQGALSPLSQLSFLHHSFFVTFS